jgi:hypothetical protein
VLKVDGGLGKNVAATALVVSIKAKWNLPLIVIASHMEPFYGNPLVDRLHTYRNLSYLYADYFADRAVQILSGEPYMHSSYLTGSHIIEVWREMFGLPTCDVAQPCLFIDAAEREWALTYLAGMKIQPEKLILLQWQGGAAPPAPGQCSAQQRRTLRRVTAQALYDGLVGMGYDVISMQLPSQPQLERCLVPTAGRGQDGQPLPLNPRQALALVSVCKSFVGIDSFVQHAAAALGKPGIVLWGGTDPRNLGYPEHKNLTAKVKCETPHCGRPNSFLFDVDVFGRPWSCPVGDMCLDFDPDEILDEFA